MKRIALVLAGALLLTGCFARGLTLNYLTPSETPFKAKPVYLKVTDVRKDKQIVSKTVTDKGLFTDVGDRVSLTGKTLDGRSATVTDVTVRDAFYEAMRLRLEALGLGVMPEFASDKLSLTIEIEKVQLDLEGMRTFKAEVVYVATLYNGSKEIRRGRITGATEKFYVLGKKDGEQCLSDALVSAVNNLDLRPFQD
ncbi:MAG: hypothetical protein AB1641_23060 [Thermodesulfobacteriota bacterium]